MQQTIFRHFFQKKIHYSPSHESYLHLYMKNNCTVCLFLRGEGADIIFHC